MDGANWIRGQSVLWMRPGRHLRSFLGYFPFGPLPCYRSSIFCDNWWLISSEDISDMTRIFLPTQCIHHFNPFGLYIVAEIRSVA